MAKYINILSDSKIKNVPCLCGSKRLTKMCCGKKKIINEAEKNRIHALVKKFEKDWHSRVNESNETEPEQR